MAKSEATQKRWRSLLKHHDANAFFSHVSIILSECLIECFVCSLAGRLEWDKRQGMPERITTLLIIGMSRRAFGICANLAPQNGISLISSVPALFSTFRVSDERNDLRES